MILSLIVMKNHALKIINSSDDSLLNQTTIINKLNTIEESLTTNTFNGLFGNLLNGTIALDAFGPVVDVSNFKESNFFILVV